MRPRADPAWVYSQLQRLTAPAAGAPLCIAFSGGADSTALLSLLAELPAAKSRLRALHIDHGLHPQSATWARACRATCRGLGVPFSMRRLTLVRSRGQSLEAVARTGRYAAFAAALRRGELLLTAHHLEDQLETVLLQLLRGAGLPGLSAMPAVMPLGRGFLVRPLLGVPREALRAWVARRGLTCLEDPSNAEASFDRNYLRREVLPPILSRWHGAARTVARSARHIAAAQSLLDGQAEADVARAADGPELSVAALRALPLERRRNALRWWIARSGRSVPDARKLEEMAVVLLAARVGANPLVRWGLTQVQRHSGRLSIDQVRPLAATFELTWNPRRSRTLALPPGRGALQLVRSAQGLIDAAALPDEVTVRTRRGGERLRPRPGGPSRTLKSLMQSEALPLGERQSLPLVFAGEQLAAAGDLWVDASWQTGTAGAQRLRLIWHRPA